MIFYGEAEGVGSERLYRKEREGGKGIEGEG